MYLDEGFVLLEEGNFTFPSLFDECEDAAAVMERGDVIHEGIALFGECGCLLSASSGLMASLN
jgi:hypothetical protein